MNTWELIGVVPALSSEQGQILSSDHLNLSKGVTIGPLPEWVKEDLILENLSWPDRGQIKNSKFSFRYLYEADGIGNEQRKAEDLLKYASLAIWIAKPIPCGINANLHFDRPDGHGIQRSATWGDQLLPHKRDHQNILTLADLLLAKSLFEQLIKIPKNHCTMRTAVHLLWRALIDPWWQSRYLCTWVALEALYGPDQAQEITFRISYRCMAFLSRNKAEAHQLFKMIKEGYRWRSKVVHGSQLNKLTPELSENISHNAENLLRRTFKKIFSEEKFVEHFNGKARDKYLDELLLEAPWNEL